MSHPLNSPKTLLVEGKDDLYVVANLCKGAGLPDRTFWIKDKEGYEKLIGDLEVELQASDLQYLGILVDADLDAVNRWIALRSQLVAAGYANVPPQPNPAGIVLRQTGKPDVGVWIMPDNTLPGMLEDFVVHLVPDGDLLWPRVQTCVAQIPREERRFPEHHLSKAHIHTWLAWQKVPGKPMGLAINATYLTSGAPQVTLFIEWLRRLFQI